MSTSVEQRDTVVVGGGQSGLAMSHLLTQQGRDHVVLEKSQQVASAWRQRWDSFTLVTPSWQLRLPGHRYTGDDPDGFLARGQVVDYLEEYAASFDPPVRFGVTATRVAADGNGSYVVETDHGRLHADNVVIAAGTFQRPRIPPASRRLPSGIQQLHSRDYRNPDQLGDGAVLVVGSGQSGSQIAQELHESGRDVHLCVSGPGRLPRRYRGRDGMWWAMQLGIMDRTVDELDSHAERFTANPRISGRDGGQTINLHEFARDGIQLLGRLEDVRDHRALLAPDLHASLEAADTMVAEFCAGVDQYVQEAGLDAPEESLEQLQDGYAQEQVTELDLAEAGIDTVLWATGYRWDYDRWVDLPVFDGFGYPVQHRGVTEHPGLYFLGLHYLHTLKSGLFLGVGEDAQHVADHLAQRSARAG